MKFRFGMISALLASLATVATSVQAAEQSDTLRNLPLGRFVDAISLAELADMVVTESKVAQTRDSVTQKIAVLRGDDIDRQPLPNRNLAELSTYVSGQFVNVLSRNDANWGSYAGLGPKYNSYLLDGLPMDSFVDAMSLDPAVIERIEIHKGPASVLYSNYLSMDFAGNEAPLAGTTNFVLKNRIENSLTQVSFGVGSWGASTGKVYRQGREGALSYVVGVSTEHADYTQVGEPGSWLQTTRAPDYDKTRLFGNLGLTLGRPDHTLSLFIQETRHTGTLGRPNRDFDHRYDTLNFAYNNAFAERWHIQFKLGERHYDREYANDDFPLSLALTSVERTRQIIRPMDLTVSYLHGQNGLLTVGADHQTVHYWVVQRSPSGLVSRQNDAEARSTGYFVQDKVQWQDWTFRAGLRRNAVRHDYALLGGMVPATQGASWDKTLWSVGTRYRVAPNLSLYANAGSSFMAPAAKQIGGTVAVPSASGELANPALKPENGIGRDFGVDWQAAAQVNVGVRAFDNRISDAIVSSVVSVSPSQSRSENAGRARARGIEFDLNQTLAPDFSWFANLTRTHTRLDNSLIPDQDGTAIPFAPRDIANLGLIAPVPGGGRLASYYHWVGRYYDSASRSSRLGFGNYGVINLRWQQPLRRGLDLVVDLVNVTNRRYDMPWSFRDPGFHGLASLNLTF